MQPVSLLAVLLFLPVFWAVSALSYILVGTSGTTWVGETLNVSLQLALALNIAAYCCAIYQRSIAAIVCNIVMTLAIVLVGFMSVLSSFPGTGSRIGNNWLDLLPWIGLAIAAIILLQSWRFGKSLVISAIVAVPTSIAALNCYLSVPLFNAIRQLELEKECVFQNRLRLKRLEELRIDLFVGEHSPRIHVYEQDRVLVWKYAGRKFSPTQSSPPRPHECRGGKMREEEK